MSALNNIDVSPLGPLQDNAIIKKVIASLFWQWFSENKDDKLIRLSFFKGLIKKTLYLRDIEPALELLFGPNPN